MLLNRKKIYTLGESILAKANKLFDFERFKKEQTEALDEMKREKIIKDSVLATANNVFDFEKFKKQQEDAIIEFKENENVEITAIKIRDNYRKMRKKQIILKPQSTRMTDNFLKL